MLTYNLIYLRSPDLPKGEVLRTEFQSITLVHFRVSAAVRSASMSCFWALLQGQIVTPEHINEVFSEMLTQV